MTPTTTTIDSHIQANLERSLSEISTLCAQPSVSARGEGVRECSAIVETLFQQYGLRTQIVETGGQPVVLGFLEGASPRRLMCYNHYDVQPPEPLDKWTTPPFTPTIRDGALYARGARDDKGEIVCRLAAIDAVRAAHGGTLPCSIVMVAEGEEEIGSPHMKEFVEQNLALLRCDGAIWEEGGTDETGRHRMPLGARGILAVELSVETMARDAHSGGAHIL
ncbi:MAG TPA: M20/M25/M40 family metallo-hydrolase, partial [Thermoflexales bacterium]|nr:M20/M25/M40 family metallo-hydrolase [Thermoflexales bacterium]